MISMEVSGLTALIFATHPVVVRIGGQYFVRSVAFVAEDESLQFFCAIDEEGVVLTIAKGVDMVENLQQAFMKSAPPSVSRNWCWAVTASCAVWKWNVKASLRKLAISSSRTT